MKLYSPKVSHYEQLQQNVFILPDNVMQRDGVACGDALALSGEINDGIVLFRMISFGCALSRASCNYLYETFSGIPVQEAAARCGQLEKDTERDPETFLAFWELPGRYELLECLASPIRLLGEFLQMMLNSAEISYQRSDTLHNLDCDACVSSARINWTGREENNAPPIPHKTYSAAYHKKWAASAKLFLSSSEIAALPELYQSMTQEDLDFLVHEKMLWSVYGNFERYGIDIRRDVRFKEFVYPLHRQYIVRRELDYIEAYIAEQQLDAHFVKGAQSTRLYEPEQYRLHLDYDVVCGSEAAAFRLFSFLYQHGFRMFSGVFSLKWIDEKEHRTCSGHFHLQKVLDAQYKIIIDITFPAFPMGRIALFYPAISGGEIRPEDLLIVAICHTFKHRNVFMKDINDVYMYLKKAALDLDYLRRRISECGMEKETALLMWYIFSNYDLPPARQKELVSRLCLDLSAQKQFPGWPYDEHSVYQVKRDDLDSRLQAGSDHPRIYLYPIAIMQALIDLDAFLSSAYGKGLNAVRYSQQSLRILSKGVEFYLFPMGLFMDSDYAVAELGRETVRSAAVSILELLGNPPRYELPYTIRLRDNWYD